MPGNISQFLADIKKQGVAKSSHFDVEFTLPVILGADSEITRTLKFRCESAELPGRQIVTTDNKIYGPIYKVPYQTLYSDMTMTFLDTADMSIRKFFEMWADSIYDASTNTIGYVNDIVADIFVTQYDVDGTPDSLNPSLKFKLIRAFPTNINQLGVTWGDDAFHRLSVTFFYERYTLIDFVERESNTVDTLAYLDDTRISETVIDPLDTDTTKLPDNGSIALTKEGLAAPIKTIEASKIGYENFEDYNEPTPPQAPPADSATDTYPEKVESNKIQLEQLQIAKSEAMSYMVELPENVAVNDVQMNELQQAEADASDYMIQLPEDPKNNDVQMNGMQQAREEANKLQRSDVGPLGSIIQDIANKVKNL